MPDFLLPYLSYLPLVAVTLGTVAAIYFVAAKLLIPILFKWLAEQSIFFTTVQEGTVKAVMRGKTFDHFLMSFKGYHLNDPRMDGPQTGFYRKSLTRSVPKEGSDEKEEIEVKTPPWEVIYHGPENRNGYDSKEAQDDNSYDHRPEFFKKLGIYWIGLPWEVEIYIYEFGWNEIETDEHGNMVIRSRDEATDYGNVRDFTYAIKTEGAETEDRLATDEITQVTVAIRNPYRAFFSGEDWIQRLTAAINGHVRYFIGQRTLEELISSKKEAGATEASGQPASTKGKKVEEEFSAPIIDLNTRLPSDREGHFPHGLRGRYGIEIRTADLQTIELSGDAAKEHEKASTAVYVAKQTAEATELAGAAEANVIRLKGDAANKVTQERIKIVNEGGQAGSLVVQTDAMRDTKAGVIWANNPFIPAAEALKSLTKTG